MFSTLLGALPRSGQADRAAEVGQNVADLEAAGLELVSDGLAPADPSAGIDGIVDAWRGAADLTTQPVKQAIRGPFEAGRDAPGSRAAAEHVAEAVAALGNAGCAFVEIVEADLSPIVDRQSERERFIDAHRSLFGALGTTTPGIHCSLVAGGGNLDTAGAATFFDLPYASYAFDLIAGPDNWRLIAAAPTDRGIVCGALDPRPEGDESRELLVWAAQYAASTGGRGIDRIGLANGWPLAGSREVALRKLRRVAEASRLVSVASADELASLLDPRAIGRRRARPGSVRLAGPDDT